MMTSRGTHPIHGHCIDIEMSVSYIPDYLVVRVGCLMYISHSGIAGLLKGHSRGFATTVVWPALNIIEAQPLHFKRVPDSE